MKFSQQGSLEKNPKSGSMWGIIIHHFHHKKWHQNVKKCLPRKHPSEDARVPSKTPAMQEKTHPVIHPAEEARSSSRRASLRSRLKALIAEKMPKRKSRRHSRSSSCPVKTQNDNEFVDIHCTKQPSGNTMSMLSSSESTSKHNGGTEDLPYMYSPALGNKSPAHIKRTPSYDEMFQRYNQILETCTNNLSSRETKEYGMSRSLTVSPVTLGRTFSLPDLRSYFHTQIDDADDDDDDDDDDVDDDDDDDDADDHCSHTPDHTNDVRNSSVAGSIEPLVINSDDTSQPLTKQDEGSENSFNCEENGMRQWPDDEEANSSGIQVESTINADETVEIEANQRYNDDDRNKSSEFNHVKNVLLEEQSSFMSNDRIILSPENEQCGGISCTDHHLMFDLVNEVLLRVGDRRSIRRRPAVVQQRNMEEVGAEIRRLVGCRAEVAAKGGDVMRWDLEKWDRWMDVQSDEESVAVEVEGLIFEDLLHEIICN